MGSKALILKINTIFILIFVTITFCKGSLYEDERRVNSEGMWQKPLSNNNIVKSKESGNFRIGMDELISNGMASPTMSAIFSFFMFPLMFPLLSMFTYMLNSGGRGFDKSGNDVLLSSNIMDLFARASESEECVERIGCEILERVVPRHKTKIFRLLRKHFYPNPVEKVDIAVTSGRKCSDFKCGVKDFIARSYAKYF